MSDTSILILGGTGKTGRRITVRLRQRGLRARAASRRGPTRFDWCDERTWAPALDGVEAVYLVDQTSDGGGLLRAFSQLAVARGTRRLVLLSGREWPGIQDAAMLARERAIEASGAAWTILRPTWFAQNFSEEPFLSEAVAAGQVTSPTGDGMHPFIDVEDVADVAVAALTEQGHAGQTYALSGPRAITWEVAVAEIAKATGRDIRYVGVSAEEYVDHLVGRGYSMEFAIEVSRLCEYIRRGKDAYLSDGVQRVLGRAAHDFTDYAKATAATGVWNA